MGPLVLKLKFDTMPQNLINILFYKDYLKNHRLYYFFKHLIIKQKKREKEI